MPAYDFVCQDCNTSFEVRLSMSAYSAGDGRTCPTCGSTKAERTFTAANVITGSRSAPSFPGGCGPSGFS